MHSTNNRLFKDFSWSAPLLFTIYFPYPVSLPVCLPFGKACCHYSPCELCVYVPAVLLTFHFSKCMLLIMKAFSPQAGELFGSTHYPCVCMCVCVCVCVCVGACVRAWFYRGIFYFLSVATDAKCIVGGVRTNICGCICMCVSESSICEVRVCVFVTALRTVGRSFNLTVPAIKTNFKSDFQH